MQIMFFLIFLTAFVFPAAPAYAVKITGIKHLFDITHNFADPSAVAVSDSGNIFVLDGVNNKIKVFNHGGEYLTSYGKGGAGEGEFNQPLGIKVDSSGNIYVADSGNHRVVILDPEGKFKAQIKIPPKNVPADPTDVAIDEKRNRCYVVDNDNHYILVYNLSTLKLIDTYGGPGSEKRKFRYPFFMTLDKNGYLYIVEVINTRVQVLNPEGLFVAYIGGWGVEKGEFYRPKGIAIDSHNRVYVSDSYLGVIQVFSNIGDFISVVGDKKTGKVKKFETPVGICIDRSNRLYVVEMFADRVGVYSLEGE